MYVVRGVCGRERWTLRIVYCAIMHLEYSPQEYVLCYKCSENRDLESKISISLNLLIDLRQVYPVLRF